MASPRQLTTWSGVRWRAVVLVFAFGMASAVNAAGNTCEFRAAGTLSLAFGDLDPSIPGGAFTATLAGALTIREFGDCKRGTFTVQIGNGGHYNGSRRLKHATTNDFIPYTLDVGDTRQYAEPGNSSYPYVLNFTGTILGRDLVNATAGSYNDTIVVSVNL